MVFIEPEKEPAKEPVKEVVPINNAVGEQAKEKAPIESKQVIPSYDQIRVRKLYAGLPVWTAVPTHTGFEGEYILVNDGTYYSLYAYINGGWRQIGTTDLTDSGETTLHSHAPVATGFTSRVRAYLGSSQNIDANTDTKVELDSENYDGDAEFDNATNYRFTAGSDGYYLVACQVALTDLDDAERVQVFIKKNGTEYSRNSSWCSKADSLTRVTLTDIVPLSAGQYIEMYARQDAADGTQVLNSGTTNTYMAIHRLS